jgi:hypothetical protein
MDSAPIAKTARSALETIRTARRDIATACDAAGLANFREALILGRLHLCGNCSRFVFASDPAALGQCSHFNVEAWPFVPMLRCSGFEARPAATAPAPDYLPDREGALARAREYAR